MDGFLSLASAKNKLRDRQYEEATRMFEQILKRDMGGAAEAAYCLGIIYHTGSGVPKDVDEAERYYNLARHSGHTMATYRLAGIFQRRGDARKAYDFYRTIAPINPSASYWAYRMLAENESLDQAQDAGERYLSAAAEQGHVLAQRVVALKYASGKMGLVHVPLGIVMLARNAFNIIMTVAIRHDRMKYK